MFKAILVIVFLSLSGCSALTGLATSAVTSAVGGSGLEVSPNVQTGGGNTASDGLVSAPISSEKTTNNQVSGNQTVNEGPPLTNQILLIIIAFAAGMFAIDNFIDWVKRFRNRKRS